MKQNRIPSVSQAGTEVPLFPSEGWLYFSARLLGLPGVHWHSLRTGHGPRVLKLETTLELCPCLPRLDCELQKKKNMTYLALYPCYLTQDLIPKENTCPVD